MFAGTAVDSFQQIRNRPNTKVHTLTLTRRVPKTGVEKAREICDLIVAHNENVEGEMRRGVVEEIREGDYVLCRNTKPLVSLYFKLLESDIKATIVGKDIEKGLLKVAEECKSYAKDLVLLNMKRYLESVASNLREMGITKVKEHQAYETAEEKVEVLTLILNKIVSAEELIPKLKELFSPHKEAVILMTLHRAKGLENNNVFVLESYNRKKLIPSKYAVQPHELLQERNLQFVAYTRHKQKLILFDFIDTVI